MYAFFYLSFKFQIEKSNFLKVVKIASAKNWFLINLRIFSQAIVFFQGKSGFFC